MLKSVKYGLSFCFLIIGGFAFQNCAPASNDQQIQPATPNDGLTNKCLNSALAGIWTSNPNNPLDPAAETLTVSDKCTASSKLCGGVTSFSDTPKYDGTAIQGPMTVKVSGSSQSADCLQDGSYDCTFGLGPSANGDVFSLECSNQHSFVFYRQSESPVQSSPKVIYYTSKFIPANFGNVANADAFCASDSPPNLVGVPVKALIASHTRRACSTPNCSTGVGENLDWVLKPNTPYFRPDGAKIGVTNSNSIFSFYLENEIFKYAGKSEFAWTGLISDWTSASQNCGSWTSLTGPAAVGYITSNESYAIGVNSTTPTAYNCSNATMRLVCVEQ